MKYLLSFSFVCLFNLFGYAHETNEAFFTIAQKENTIEVRAEFPWTMRQALIEFNPLLENATSKKDFENTFVQYLKENFKLINVNGDRIEFQEYQQLENTGHSHQNNYLITFKGSGLNTIQNTIMFNVYENQVNYHTVTIDSRQKTFKTQKGQTIFTLSKNTNTQYYWLWMALIIPLIYFLNKYGNNIKLYRRKIS